MFKKKIKTGINQLLNSIFVAFAKPKLIHSIPPSPLCRVSGETGGPPAGRLCMFFLTVITDEAAASPT